MAHMKPLSAESHPELADDFKIFEDILGFVPNSLLTMQRRPKIVQAFGVLTKAVMDPIWDYQTSPLYTDAERVALDYALAAGSVPNAVDDELMERMNKYWSEEQIVEILGAVCLYGFLNRWNDSMATDLEESPKLMGERVLAKGGWTGGKHTR